LAGILYLMPGIEAGAEDMARRERIANTFLTNPSANRVRVDECDEGPISIESAIESDVCVTGMLKKSLKLNGTYDALIVGCAGDPGLTAMRQLLDVPVIGPLESSTAFSSVLGDKFSVITILDEGKPGVWANLRKNNQAHRCASVRAINAHVWDMIDGKVSRDTVLETVEREVAGAIKDGASSVILGCMTMAFLLVDEQIHMAAPVINPVKIAVKTAEMQLGLGIMHSRLSYPSPEMDKLKRTILPEIR
jgi:allantoin racemase